MFWKKKPEKKQKPSKKRSSFFSTDSTLNISSSKVIRNALAMTFQRTHKDDKIVATGQDSVDVKSTQYYGQIGSIPDNQLSWYGAQSFIGYQACAMLAQNWLISKACSVPPKDAVRKGYEITINNGTDVDPEIIDEIKQLNKHKYKLNKNLVELGKFTRVFGVRIAIFKVESTDPLYYEKPFNIDGVTPGSYQGISQVDPYWCVPTFEGNEVSDTSAIDFYEPTYWTINGKKYHKSHLILNRTDELADILKPTYLYGGIPLPQKIYERVYSAEATANEAPQLAKTKRMTVYKTDIAAALANQQVTEGKLYEWAYYRDNFGIKLVDKVDEDIAQFDTALGDLDAIIMTQYQLVASIANTPATKLLGTTPKGFNSTGEYEEANYREELESIQDNEYSPLIERHHQLVCKSDLNKKYGLEIETTTVFNPLDSLTELEQADVNLKKSQTDQAYVNMGAIDGLDVREKITADENSGYNGLAQEEEPIEEPEAENGESQAIPEA